MIIYRYPVVLFIRENVFIDVQLRTRPSILRYVGFKLLKRQLNTSLDSSIYLPYSLLQEHLHKQLFSFEIFSSILRQSSIFPDKIINSLENRKEKETFVFKSMSVALKSQVQILLFIIYLL